MNYVMQKHCFYATYPWGKPQLIVSIEREDKYKHYQYINHSKRYQCDLKPKNYMILSHKIHFLKS